MTFAQFDLNANILKALQVCGYTEPTPIQKQSIPAILGGKDLVGCAQTGTGKTAAFVLPALQLISASRASKPRVLILTPTRELATQISQAISKYGKFLQFKSVNLVGGMPYHKQIQGLSRSPDIIVATPGRLLDHMQQKRVDLSAIEMLVLDEADRMLDMGFIDDVQKIAKATPQTRQTLLFSATIDTSLSHLIQKLLKHPVNIDLSKEKIYPTQIRQEIYFVDNFQHKTKLLEHFLRNTQIFKAIIFTATKASADNLAKQLCKDGFKAAPLHGDLRQSTRNRTVDQLRHGKIQYLVATDVAARGIDIRDITHVINFDIPRFFEDYVHRIGRTGRAGKTGLAITFATPIETHHVSRIEKFIKQKIELMTVPGLEPTHRVAAPKKDKSRYRTRKHEKGGKHKDSGSRFGKDRYEHAGYKKKKKQGFKSKDKFRDERDHFHQRDEKPKKRFNDRPERFERSDERPKKRFNDRPERFERSDERPKKRFNDRPERFERSDGRPKKRFNDRPERFERSDERPKKRFNDRPERFERSDERPKKRFNDRPERFERSDERLKKRFNDRPERFERSDERLKKRFNDRPERFERSDERPKKRFNDNSKHNFKKKRKRKSF